MPARLRDHDAGVTTRHIIISKQVPSHESLKFVTQGQGPVALGAQAQDLAPCPLR
jgi:hypothetical protein